MENPKTHDLAVRIYDALNKKGAGLGDAAIGIIESAIKKSAQQSRAADEGDGYDFTDPDQNPWLLSHEEAERMSALRR